jgi:hypothetical protein
MTIQSAVVPTPFVTFMVESHFVPTLSGRLALIVNWIIPVDATYEQIDVIEADYKNFAQELVKQGWTQKLADYRLDNRGYVVIFEMPKTRLSKNHVGIIGEFEYFADDTGNLYRARLSNAIDINGYRLGGRWQAPPHMAVDMFNSYRSLLK